MSELKQGLEDLTVYWRVMAEQARMSACEIDNLAAKGHLQGMGSAFDEAATHAEALIAQEFLRLKNQLAITPAPGVS